MFGGRMKRQLRIGKITDPLVEKTTLTLSEMLKTTYPEYEQDLSEILYFSMWIVFLSFSNAKPIANRKEQQALNDAYGQIFNGLAMQSYDAERHTVISYVVPFVNQCLVNLQNRCIGYNNSYSRDRGVVLVTPDEDMGAFVSTHVTNMMKDLMKNVFGDRFSSLDSSDLDEEFIRGFNCLFLSTLTEATAEFRELTI